MADYIQQQRDALAAARKRLREGAEIAQLKASAPTLFEIIDGEISLELNRAFGDEPLAYNEYLESHGAVRGIRRIRNLIDGKEIAGTQAAGEVAAIESNLENMSGN